MGTWAPKRSSTSVGYVEETIRAARRCQDSSPSPCEFWALGVCVQGRERRDGGGRGGVTPRPRKCGLDGVNVRSWPAPLLWRPLMLAHECDVHSFIHPTKMES